MDNQTDRYIRQRRLPEIGDAGQDKLAQARVLIVGCGALGSVQAELMARAGVGQIRIVDRDVADIGNLHRQFLLDEDDVTARLPKAQAAARRLRRINSQISVEAIVQDVRPGNVEDLVKDVDLVLDGTDNFETRYVLNDACVKHARPWVYGGVIGTTGQVFPIRPGGPCLRCLFPEPPDPGSVPTCDRAGVLNTASATIAALQATWAVKLLTGADGLGDTNASPLQVVDPWHGESRTIVRTRNPNCPCCARRQFQFLAETRTSWCSVLCGRNTVQVTPASPVALDLHRLAAELKALGQVTANPFLIEFAFGGYELTIFADGRVLVAGTTDAAKARDLVSRFIGV